MKLTNEEIQKNEKLLRDSSYAKYHKRLQIIYFRSKEKSYKEIMGLLDCNKTTVWRNLKKYKEFGLEALLQETRGGRHREYMTYEEEQVFLKRHIEAAQTGDPFFLIAGGCNTEWTNKFLRQVSQDYPDDCILLVMDNAIWHKSSTLEIPSNIELAFIPPYTPEMNPIEQVWKEI